MVAVMAISANGKTYIAKYGCNLSISELKITDVITRRIRTANRKKVSAISSDVNRKGVAVLERSCDKQMIDRTFPQKPNKHRMHIATPSTAKSNQTQNDFSFSVTSSLLLSMIVARTGNSLSLHKFYLVKICKMA